MDRVQTARQKLYRWQAVRTEPERIAERYWYYVAKRTFDLLVAAVGLIVFSPIMLLVALAIVIDSRGTIIFSQERMGYSWRTGTLRPFMFLKFRSMFEDADSSVHQEYVRSWINGNNGNGSSNGHDKVGDLRRDKRVTRVGRVIRRTSLDEIPQLINVLRGEMSLVGPRPVPVYEVEEYEPRHMARLLATPGITGAWQVAMRGHGSVDDMTRLDVEYIQHQSMTLDLRILWQTIPAWISGRGAA
ncbi:MAG: sugar transferase [Chloroflexi bacterium]|nr:sugar transferase [Chloroflexota bacterium]